MFRRVAVIRWFAIATLTLSGRLALAIDPPTPERVRSLVKQLDSDSYQARQRANIELVKLGRKVIPDVVAVAAGESLEATYRAINVLEQLGTSTDQATEDAAYAALASLMQSKSGVISGQASRTLDDLKKSRHGRTVAQIKQHGGSVSTNNNMQGVWMAGPGGMAFQQSSAQDVSVTIGPGWTGGRQEFSLLRRLRSLSSLTLEGDQITDDWLNDLRGIETSNLKHLILKRTKLTDDGLAHIATMKSLQMLEIFYAPVTDAAAKKLEHLKELEIAKFYGTKLSAEGAEALAAALPNASIDRRGGALLGVGGMSMDGPCTISTVEPGSAAHKAGIRKDDIIAKFDGKPISNFTQLTSVIAQKVGGERVVVEVLRAKKRKKLNVTLGEW